MTPLPPLPDPRLQTCCLARDPKTDRVCHHAKHHDEPHDWEPAPAEDDT